VGELYSMLNACRGMGTREREDSRSLSYSPLLSLLSSPFSNSFLFHPFTLPSPSLPLHSVSSLLYVFSVPSRPFPLVSVPVSVFPGAADSTLQNSEQMIIARTLPVPVPLPLSNRGTGSISGIKSKISLRFDVCNLFWNRDLSSPLQRSLPGPASCCPCSSAL
jgi:hypothetical protein